VRRDAEVTAAEAAGDRLGNVRLALAAVTLVLVLLPLYTRDGRPWWALLPVAVVFVVLGALHARASEREARARAARAYWQAEKDRVQEKWRELPDQGRDLLPSATTFDARVGLAGDLDLFGPASLYQLLSRAVTPRGRQTLAAWLLEPAAPAEIRARQEAVRELAAKPELREALAVAARMGAEVKLSETGLLAWGESPRPLRFGGVLRIVALLETAALLTTAGVWLALGMPEPFVVALIVQVATLLAIRGPVMERAGRINSPDRALMRFAELLAVIETTPVAAPRLLDARTRLATEGVPASQRLASLRGLVERLEASGNMFFAVTLGPALFWDLHLVLAAERWQLQVGPKLRGWLEVIGEVEALASLGAFLAVRPDASMPELVDGEGVYEVHGLSHPLLDRTRAVANDVTLGGPGSVLLLSGSNMSGKSTFLRAIGLSCVLAQAGGPGHRAEAAAEPGGVGHVDPRGGLAGAGRLALLRRAAAHQVRAGHGPRAAQRGAAHVPARRDAARHQLQGALHRRGGGGALAGPARRGGRGDHARSLAGAGGRRAAGWPRGQPPLRRRGRRRAYPLRLRAQAGRGCSPPTRCA
jgi:hypothetical protein